MSDDQATTVRLLFVDEGSYYHEIVRIPAGVLDGYARLIDCLREEPSVLERLYVDVDRLCSASVVDGDGEGAGGDEGDGKDGNG